MKGTKYLSELVDCSALQEGKLNVIKAPTGSGKTYFALQHIPSLTEDTVHEVVYLIDTTNGREQIIRNYNAISEYRMFTEQLRRQQTPLRLFFASFFRFYKIFIDEKQLRPI